MACPRSSYPALKGSTVAKPTTACINIRSRYFMPIYDEHIRPRFHHSKGLRGSKTNAYHGGMISNHARSSLQSSSINSTGKVTKSLNSMPIPGYSVSAFTYGPSELLQIVNIYGIRFQSTCEYTCHRPSQYRIQLLNPFITPPVSFAASSS